MVEVITKTLKDIIDDANRLAAEFARMEGWEFPDDFKFYEKVNSRYERYWDLACYAYDFIEGTDVKECLDEYLDQL